MNKANHNTCPNRDQARFTLSQPGGEELSRSALAAYLAGKPLARFLPVMGLLALAGCVAAPDGGPDQPDTLSEYDPEESALPQAPEASRPAARPSSVPAEPEAASSDLATFAAEHRRTLLGDEVYVVEGDLVFDDPLSAHAYLQTLRPQQKSIVNLTPAGKRDVRADADPSTPVYDFTYCFESGAWGGTVDTDGNGRPDDFDGDGRADLMPTIASVRVGLEAGMRAWEGVANVRFVYASGSDGASCATSGVSFRIALDATSSCTATGPFPSRSRQALTIPRCGLDELLAMHELGHTIGFRHEHIHSGATPRCSEGDSSYEQLFTEYDGQSAMVYANCTTGSFIGGFRVSRLDGMGARILYGNPLWWWGAQL